MDDLERVRAAWADFKAALWAERWRIGIYLGACWVAAAIGMVIWLAWR